MEHLLKRYKTLSKKERKGFTLVELLVVIAILAVLASVSVVGYLGFTTKAKNSNALTEMTQIKELIRDELLDGNTHTYKYGTTTGTDNTTTKDKNVSFTYATDTSSSTTTTYSIKFTLENSEKGDTGSSILKACFTDLKTLNGTLFVTSNPVTLTTGTTSEVSITTITYKTTDKAYVQWTISDGSIKNIDTFTETDFQVTSGN